MNILGRKIKRNKEVIKNSLKLKDNRFICNTDKLFIIFPKRFLDKNLCRIDSTITIVGHFMLMDDLGNYALFNISTKIKLMSADIKTFSENEQEFNYLTYEKNDTIILDNQVVKTEEFFFTLFDEFYILGKVPFYMEYEDLANIFINSKKYCNSNIANNPLGLEVISSLLVKQAGSGGVDIRFSPDKPVEFIGASNVFRALPTALSKIAGAHMKHGVLSSIIDEDTDEASNIEKILRA